MGRLKSANHYRLRMGTTRERPHKPPKPPDLQTLARTFVNHNLPPAIEDAFRHRELATDVPLETLHLRPNQVKDFAQQCQKQIHPLGYDAELVKTNIGTVLRVKWD